MSEQTATPSSHWRAEGQADPHAGHYDCERAALAMGNLTDDQLANAAFMFYNDYPSLQDVLDGKAFQPIAYMTAVKDRIRWLSRSLEKVTAELAAVRESRDVMSECHRINVAERDSRIAALEAEVARLRVPPHSVEAEQSVLGGLLLARSVRGLALLPASADPQLVRDRALLWLKEHP